MAYINLLNCDTPRRMAFNMTRAMAAGRFPDGILGEPDARGNVGFTGTDELYMGAPPWPTDGTDADALAITYLQKIRANYPRLAEAQAILMGEDYKAEVDYRTLRCLGFLPFLARLQLLQEIAVAYMVASLLHEAHLIGDHGLYLVRELQPDRLDGTLTRALYSLDQGARVCPPDGDFRTGVIFSAQHLATFLRQNYLYAPAVAATIRELVPPRQECILLPSAAEPRYPDTGLYYAPTRSPPSYDGVTYMGAEAIRAITSTGWSLTSCDTCHQAMPARHQFCRPCWDAGLSSLGAHCWLCPCGYGPNTGDTCEGPGSDEDRCDIPRSMGHPYGRDTPAAALVYDDAWLRSTSLYSQFILARSTEAIRKDMPAHLTQECRRAIDRAVSAANPGAVQAAAPDLGAGGASLSAIRALPAMPLAATMAQARATLKPLASTAAGDDQLTGASLAVHPPSEGSVRFTCSHGAPTFVGMARDVTLLFPSASVAAPVPLEGPLIEGQTILPVGPSATITFGLTHGPTVLRGSTLGEFAQGQAAAAHSSDLHARLGDPIRPPPYVDDARAAALHARLGDPIPGSASAEDPMADESVEPTDLGDPLPPPPYVDDARAAALHARLGDPIPDSVSAEDPTAAESTEQTDLAKSTEPTDLAKFVATFRGRTGTVIVPPPYVLGRGVPRPADSTYLKPTETVKQLAPARWAAYRAKAERLEAARAGIVPVTAPPPTVVPVQCLSEQEAHLPLAIMKIAATELFCQAKKLTARDLATTVCPVIQWQDIPSWLPRIEEARVFEGVCQALLRAPPEHLVQAYTFLEEDCPTLRAGVEGYFAGATQARVAAEGGSAAATGAAIAVQHGTVSIGAVLVARGPGVPAPLTSGYLTGHNTDVWRAVSADPDWLHTYPLTFMRGKGIHRPARTRVAHLLQPRPHPTIAAAYSSPPLTAGQLPPPLVDGQLSPPALMDPHTDGGRAPSSPSDASSDHLSALLDASGSGDSDSGDSDFGRPDGGLDMSADATMGTDSEPFLTWLTATALHYVPFLGDLGLEYGWVQERYSPILPAPAAAYMLRARHEYEDFINCYATCPFGPADYHPTFGLLITQLQHWDYEPLLAMLHRRQDIHDGPGGGGGGGGDSGQGGPRGGGTQDPRRDHLAPGLVAASTSPPPPASMPGGRVRALEPCRLYSRGQCRWGESCRHMHGAQAARPAATAAVEVDNYHRFVADLLTGWTPPSLQPLPVIRLEAPTAGDCGQPPRELCRRFVAKKCIHARRGSNCRFSHDAPSCAAAWRTHTQGLAHSEPSHDAFDDMPGLLDDDDLSAAPRGGPPAAATTVAEPCAARDVTAAVSIAARAAPKTRITQTDALQVVWGTRVTESPWEPGSWTIKGQYDAAQESRFGGGEGERAAALSFHNLAISLLLQYGLVPYCFNLGGGGRCDMTLRRDPHAGISRIPKDFRLNVSPPTVPTAALLPLHIIWELTVYRLAGGWGIIGSGVTSSATSGQIFASLRPIGIFLAQHYGLVPVGHSLDLPGDVLVYLRVDPMTSYPTPPDHIDIVRCTDGRYATALRPAPIELVQRADGSYTSVLSDRARSVLPSVDWGRMARLPVRTRAEVAAYLDNAPPSTPIEVNPTRADMGGMQPTAASRLRVVRYRKCKTIGEFLMCHPGGYATETRADGFVSRRRLCDIDLEEGLWTGRITVPMALSLAPDHHPSEALAPDALGREALPGELPHHGARGRNQLTNNDWAAPLRAMGRPDVDDALDVLIRALAEPGL
jgi:hypothetical protein